MKTINKFFVLLMLAMPFIGFTSCDDDDDNNDGTVDAIVGSYKGGTGSLKLWELLPVADDVTIKIEKTDDSHVKFPIDLEFTVMIGETTGPKVRVVGDCVNGMSYADGKYTISAAKGNSFKVTITQPGSSTPQTIENLSVSIEGTIVNKVASLEILVPLPAQLLAAFSGIPGMGSIIGQLTPDQNGNVNVEVNFTGTKL